VAVNAGTLSISSALDGYKGLNDKFVEKLLGKLKA